MKTIKRFFTPGWHILLLIWVALTECLLTIFPTSVYTNGVIDALHGGAVFVMRDRVAAYVIMILLLVLNFVSFEQLEGRAWNNYISVCLILVIGTVIIFIPFFLYQHRTILFLDVVCAAACAAAGFNLIATSIYFMYDRWCAFDAYLSADDDCFDDDCFDDDEEDGDAHFEHSLIEYLRALRANDPDDPDDPDEPDEPDEPDAPNEPKTPNDQNDQNDQNNLNDQNDPEATAEKKDAKRSDNDKGGAKKMGMAIFDPEKQYTYIKGFADGANLTQTLKALAFAREKHSGQMRRSGDPYITHPLTIACHAIACGVHDDVTLATLLLHDTLEDCALELDNLPVNDKVKHAVDMMTFRVLPGETTQTAAIRYFNQLPSCKEAALCKLFDRAHNVSTYVSTASMEKLKAYIVETRTYIVPLLREVKKRYPECGNLVMILKYHIVSVCDSISLTLEACGQ